MCQRLPAHIPGNCPPLPIDYFPSGVPGRPFVCDPDSECIVACPSDVLASAWIRLLVQRRSLQIEEAGWMAMALRMEYLGRVSIPDAASC
jgi:hypothetical protein